MTIERLIRILAGSFILASLALSQIYNDADLFSTPTWLWFTAFIGINLFQSGFTRWCLMEKFLKVFGFKCGCDDDDI